MISDKVCIVTGAGSGIGHGVAIELGAVGATVVANDLGASVVGEGSDADPAEETAARIRDEGGEAMAHYGDVTSLEYTEGLIHDTVETYGRVDGIVNFAGFLRNTPIVEMTSDEWDDVTRVHLRGHFSLLKNAAIHWTSEFQQGGLDSQRSFLCVASRAAMGRVHEANYSAGKAGVLGFARSAARELFESNIRVNALMPTAHTRMTDYVYEDNAEAVVSGPSPAQIAPLVGYLFSDAADGIAGRTVRVAGDSVGVVSDPEIVRLGVKDDGWSVESIADRFRDDIAEGIELTNVDPAF